MPPAHEITPAGAGAGLLHRVAACGGDNPVLAEDAIGSAPRLDRAFGVADVAGQVGGAGDAVLA